MPMSWDGDQDWVDLKKERGRGWTARWVRFGQSAGAAALGGAVGSDRGSIAGSAMSDEPPKAVAPADSGPPDPPTTRPGGKGRPGIGWGVLRPAEVVRREFGLEEVALRADPGVLRFEALQHLGSAAADVSWCVRAHAPSGGRVRVELRSVAVRQAERLCERLESMGATPERLLDPADVLEAAWQEALGSTALGEPCVILFVGGRESLLLWRDAAARRVRSLALGWRTLVEEVSGRLDTGGIAGAPDTDAREPEGAECVRRTRDAEVAATLAARAHFEVSRLLSTTAGAAPDRPLRPARVWVCGEAPIAPECVAALESRLGLPVETWEDWGGDVEWLTEPPAERRLAWDLQVRGVLRLWQRRGEDDATSACFLPPVRSDRLARRFTHITMLGAAALVSLAMLPPAWHYQRLAKETADRVRRLDEEVQRLQRVDAENRAALVRLNAERSRVEALHALASARLRWPRFLGGLEQCLEEVEDAWLDGLQPAGNASSRTPGALHVRVTGCLLASEAGEDSGALNELASEPRVQALLAQVARLPSIERIERERFARTEPGMLRFDLELALSEEALR